MTNEREHLHYLVPVFWTISLATLFCQISAEMNFSFGDKVVKGDRLYKHLATHSLKGGCPETFSGEERLVPAPTTLQYLIITKGVRLQ